MKGDMQRRRVLQRIAQLNVWRQGDVRAPHKPLLFLLGVSRVLNGEERLVQFGHIEQELTRLLRTYGPVRKQVHPEYPFWWLQNDGLWEVIASETLGRRQSSNAPTRTALRAAGVGGFPIEVDTVLRKNKRLVRQAVSLVLHAHFTDSLHESILNDIGIDLDIIRIVDARDGEFRREVIEAYEHRCAVCGFDVRLAGGIDLALEAAHIKWRQAGGPDVVQNGIALCGIHHKALDFGAITIGETQRILVSGSAHGVGAFSRWFGSFHRRPVRLPHSQHLCVDPSFAGWHRREVFREPARE